jgi:alkylation response protein AidB-like acyl-CoA dehydrogenase
VPEIGPLIDGSVAAIDEMRDLPPALFSALRERGLFRLVQPEEYGGAELDPPSLVQVIEAVACRDASTALCIGQTNICAIKSTLLAPSVARDIFGPDTGILAWGPGPGEARVMAGGGYRVTGNSDFASGSRLASWLGAHVPVIEPDGNRRLGSGGKPITYTMFFPWSSAVVRDT